MTVHKWLWVSVMICAMTSVSCTSSVVPSEQVAVTDDEIRECVRGIWIAPAKTCDCSLVESPECGRPDCIESSLHSFWEENKVTTMAIRYTTGADPIISVLVSTGRGDWRVEDGELAWDLGFSNVFSGTEVACSPSRMRWFNELTPASAGMQAVVRERRYEERWQAVSYDPAL